MRVFCSAALNTSYSLAYALIFILFYFIFCSVSLLHSARLVDGRHQLTKHSSVCASCVQYLVFGVFIFNVVFFLSHSCVRSPILLSFRIVARIVSWRSVQLYVDLCAVLCFFFYSSSQLCYIFLLVIVVRFYVLAFFIHLLSCVHVAFALYTPFIPRTSMLCILSLNIHCLSVRCNAF